MYLWILLDSEPMQIILRMLWWIGAVAVLFLLLVLILHTAFLFGHRFVLYKNAEPLPGWSKQFYPATLLLILVIIGLLWWVAVILQN